MLALDPGIPVIPTKSNKFSDLKKVQNIVSIDLKISLNGQYQEVEPAVKSLM